MSRPVRTDPVLLEIFRNRFKAIAEEMASVTLRTGFTPFVKETSDFGACLVAPNGEVMAAPTDTAVSMMVGLPAKTAIMALGAYEEGDIGVSNDPELTQGLSTHLPDIWVWKPIFVEGQIVAFAFNFIHSSDVGGKVPGSISPSNYEIYQEGIRIPPLKLFRAGELNEELLRLILLNCRIPDQNWGDIKAQVASLNTAERRIQEVAARYGRDVVVQGIADLMDHAESRARALIGQLPQGEYPFADYMEGDVAGGRPIRIKLTLGVRAGELWLDFTGTDLQVRAALNLPSWNRASHYMIGFPLLNYFRTIEPDIPYNSGLVRPIVGHIPAGTLLNPDPHMAFGVRAATSFRVLDCIAGCLSQALPDIFPAASSGGIAIVLVSTLDVASGERKVSVAQPLSGGSGGRPRQQGIDGTSFTGGWLRNIPNEAIEAEMPVLVEQYSYRAGSPGAGRSRGGAGIHFRLKTFAPETVMTARGMERFTFRPWGAHGGRAGELGTCTLNPGTPDARDLGKLDVLNLNPGDVVDFQTASGGGWGDPYQRDPHLVAADVAAGFFDAEAARRDYGVGLTETGAVDEAATAALRRQPAAAPRYEPFDFGPERRAYEARWPHTLQDALLDRLTRHPSALRPFLRDRITAWVDARLTAGTAPADELIDQALAETLQRLEGSMLATATPTATAGTHELS